MRNDLIFRLYQTSSARINIVTYFMHAVTCSGARSKPRPDSLCGRRKCTLRVSRGRGYFVCIVRAATQWVPCVFVQFCPMVDVKCTLKLFLLSTFSHATMKQYIGS